MEKKDLKASDLWDAPAEAYEAAEKLNINTPAEGDYPLTVIGHGNPIEEDQHGLWMEIIGDIDGDQYISRKYLTLINKLKSKFHISRKPTIK